MTVRERFTRSQIVLMRSLIKRGASIRAVTIAQWQRLAALPLWRRGIVEIWYRQSPETSVALQGPFYGLTIAGARIASSFVHPAPRGSSGAGEMS